MSIAALFAASALVFANPILLLGAVSIWVWLLVMQLRFVQYTQAVWDDLELHQTVSDSVVTTSDDVIIQLKAEFPESLPCSLRLTSLPPLVATAPSRNSRSVWFDSGEQHKTLDYSVTMRAAGQTTPRGVRALLRDPAGLFTQTWDWSDDDCTPTIDVRPYGPRNIHVGTGQESLGQGYGEHVTEYSGGGIEPLELREYVPGDALSRIDWKATARLAEPYIREYEATADRQTLLVVDHRDEMATGDVGRTMLDHGRSVGTAVVQTARQLSDPLGWLTVGNNGITQFIHPQSTPDQYQQAQRTLEKLEPTPAATSSNSAADTPTKEPSNARSADGGPTARAPGDVRSSDNQIGASTQTAVTSSCEQPYSAITPVTVADRRQFAQRLAGENSSFATRLRPFYADSTEYIHSVAKDPLFRSLDVARQQIGGAVWTILVSSDQRPVELLEAVRAARQGGNHVIAFLTPTVLFAPVDSDNMESAYEQYRAFHELRQRLERHERVTAFEVGPRDRLADILASNPEPAEQTRRETVTGSSSSGTT